MILVLAPPRNALPWRLRRAAEASLGGAGRVVSSQAEPGNEYGRTPLVLAAMIVAIAAGSLALQMSGLAYRVPDEEEGLYEFVRTHRRPGEVYLLPIRMPDLAAGPRGSPSTTFVSPREAAGENRIPIDLQRFRLATGAAIYVDFKSIPYKDVEVLEWYRRMRVGDDWQFWHGWPDRAPPETVTHIVERADQNLDPARFELIFADANYRVFTLVNRGR